MCGIAGFWGRSASADITASNLRKMSDSIAFRGPDDLGEWFDLETGIGLAHRRLAILDLSENGHQPMHSSSDRFVIVFNGEIFNFQEIQRQLEPHHWRSNSDTEVILEAFERWGIEDSVRKFVGMFAFALWDKQDRKLHLVRDRLGIKPLYYALSGGKLYFASQVRPISSHCDFNEPIDRDSLALYFRHTYIPAPFSIFQNVRKLGPGTIATFSDFVSEPVVRKYWEMEKVVRDGMDRPFTGSENEAQEEFERRLEVAVRSRMLADVPLGAFLSGGIDSSTIVSLMQKNSSAPIKTFTIGFHSSALNEADHARKVAAHLGTEHLELYVTDQEAMNVVPDLDEWYDEPFADSSQIPTYLVSKLARNKVTVALSGDGGDELLGGYERYTIAAHRWKKISRVPQPVREMSSRLLPRSSGKIGRVKLALSAETEVDFYRGAVTYWVDPFELVNGSKEAVYALNKKCTPPEGLRATPLMMYLDSITYLPDDILVKVDRASMAVGLEARVPLLDHRLLEFAWSLPQSFKSNSHSTKLPLRKALEKYVPRHLTDRPKAGFAVPLADWLRTGLKEWASDLLSASSLQKTGLLNGTLVVDRWEKHLAGQDFSAYLWPVLMFEQWNRRRSS